MTTEQTPLPITEYLEEHVVRWMKEYNRNPYKENLARAEVGKILLPQVRTLEEAQQKEIEEMKKLNIATLNGVYNLLEQEGNKAKEEERERTIQQVVGILEEIRNGYNQSFHPNLRIALQEAITRIINI